MYTHFYGLTEKPFQIVPNPRYLYLSDKHQNALTHLEYGIMEEGSGIVLLSGEIGTGKTTLIRHILHQIGTEMTVAVIFNTNVTPVQLIKNLVVHFGIKTASKDKAVLLTVLRNFVVKKYQNAQRTLVIIDEAQNLSNETLEEVRLLSNLHSDAHKLIQIILAGQPQLLTKLKHHQNQGLRHRISVAYHLSVFSLPETAAYIVFRLKKANAQRPIFTSKAVETIFKASRGVPRTINQLCDAALVYGYADEKKRIDEVIIDQVIKDKGDFLAEAGSQSTASLADPGQVAEIKKLKRALLRAKEQNRHLLFENARLKEKQNALTCLMNPWKTGE